MRIFWACTHLTLRDTELPVFLDAGVEMIPEEVDCAVLDPVEAADYDDANVHAVHAKWRAGCTLEEPFLTLARRCRLRQRRGLPSEEERELFNSYFDAIYIATDLDAAINVASWFRGEVLFRYFGVHNNLRSIRELADKHDPAKLKKLVVLPIFDSHLELGIESIFDRVAIVHACVEPGKIGSWQGWREHQTAVATIGTIETGNFQERLARAVIPIAGAVPLIVLGKNNLSFIPNDLKRELSITGMLPRDEYLKRFLSARFLLHPYPGRHHNHYTNVEAVSAGLPVLFLQHNPLYRENRKFLGEDVAPESFGAFADLEALGRACVEFYADRHKLEALSAKQGALLKAFSPAIVRNEVEQLIRLLKTSRREEPLRPFETAFAKLPPATQAKRRLDFQSGANEIPFWALVGEPGISRLESDEGDVSVVASRNVEQILVVEREFAAGQEHSFFISGRGEAGASLTIVLEAWSDGERIGVTHAVWSGVQAGERGAFSVPFQVVSPKPFFLSLYVQAFGGGRLYLRTLRHEAASLSRGGTVGVFSASEVFRRLHAGETLAPMHILPPGATDKDERGALKVGPEPRQIILGDRYKRVIGPHYTLHLTFEGANEAQLEICVETWSDDAVVHRLDATHAIDGEATIELVVGDLPAGNGVVPVLYVSSKSESQVALTGLSIEAFETMHTRGEDVALDEHPAPAPGAKFYGQFDPPIDRVLYERYFQNLGRVGVFLECGAADGRTDSSCLFFRETLGWTGVNIEASRHLYALLLANRPGERNVFAALSDQKGVARFRNAVHPGLGRRFGNGSLSHTDHHLRELNDLGCAFEEYEVETVTFAEIVDRFDLSTLDLMVLDVEGHELQVIDGMKRARVLPRVLCVEHGQLGMPDLKAALAPLGYRFDIESFANSVWVREQTR